MQLFSFFQCTTCAGMQALSRVSCVHAELMYSIVGSATFSYCTVPTRSRPLQDVKDKARTDFGPTYTAECAFWSVFQTGACC